MKNEAGEEEDRARMNRTFMDAKKPELYPICENNKDSEFGHGLAKFCFHIITGSCRVYESEGCNLEGRYTN